MNLPKSVTVFSHRPACSACVIVLLVLTGQISQVLGDTTTGTTGGNAPLENRQPTLAIHYMIATYGTLPQDAPTTLTETAPPNRTDPFLGEIKAVPFDFLPQGWMFCEGQLLQINQHQALFSLLGTTYGGNGTTNFALPDLRGRVPIGAGQGPGLPNYQLGDVVGNASPVLSVANLPVHSHTFSGGNTQPAGSATPLDNRQPSLALNFLIAANGEVMIVPWTIQPEKWAQCDGRLLTKGDHTYLFSHIGTTYGGNGTTDFAIPDLRGRVVVGDDDSLWPRGLKYGSNDVVLNIADMRAHTHTVPEGSTGSTGGAGDSANNYQPSLVMRWLLSLYGSFPNPNQGRDFPMVGEMRLVAGVNADGLGEGWSPLFGQLQSISENETLFQLLGTRYGGDGQDTFALPDLRSRVDVGVNGSSLVLAEFVGSQILTMSILQLSAHAHSLLQLRISAIQHFGDGSVELTLSGTIDNTCQVDKSDDLASWTNLGAVQFNNSSETITDPNPTQTPARFYRAYFP